MDAWPQPGAASPGWSAPPPPGPCSGTSSRLDPQPRAARLDGEHVWSSASRTRSMTLATTTSPGCSHPRRLEAGLPTLRDEQAAYVLATLLQPDLRHLPARYRKVVAITADGSVLTPTKPAGSA